MSIIVDKKIQMLNYILLGLNNKCMTVPTKDDWMVGYVNDFTYIEDVDHFIHVANDALNNVFTNTNNGWISTFGYYVKISTTTLTFYEEDETTVIATETTQDFIELLQSWKTFLQTPPFHNQKI
jgi:hypothetical protein